MLCLPGAQGQHITHWIHKLLGGAGEDQAVIVYIGTNDKARGRWKVLDFRDFASMLK